MTVLTEELVEGVYRAVIHCDTDDEYEDRIVLSKAITDLHPHDAEYLIELLDKAIARIRELRETKGRYKCIVCQSMNPKGDMEDLEGLPPDGICKKCYGGMLASEYRHWHRILHDSHQYDYDSY